MNKSSEYFKTAITIVFCISTCFSNPSLSVISKINQNIEYRVQIGDSQTYIFTKVYSYFSIPPYEFQMIGVREEGGFVVITIREGTTLTYTITSIPRSGLILGTRTYNGNITLQEESFIPFIRKTVTNRSYLVEYCNYYGNNSSEFIISGNLITQEILFVNQSLQTNQGIINVNTTLVDIWNWKTGWQVYQLIKQYNSTTTFYEEERELLDQNSSNENNNSNLIFGSILFLTLMIVLIITAIYQKKKKSIFH